MRRPMLLAAVLAGCLNLSGLAEAHDRDGHQGRQLRSFAHQPFGDRHRAFGFAHRHQPHWSGPPSGLRAFAPPPRHRSGFDGFDHRRHGARSVERQALPPLGRMPGHRILSGRQILPFVGRPARLSRPFVSVHRHRFPTFVRVFPAPGFGFRHRGFGIPHRRDGLTIILREPGVRRW